MLRWRTTGGSTGRLIQLCLGYFTFYVITGIAVKYFLAGPPSMDGMQYLLYSTVGGVSIALFVVLALRWYRIDSNRRIQVGNVSVPSEVRYIIPSGVCTAVIVPTTTLMYSFDGLSVMVAMTIMRASVILISRAVDGIQIRQGILKKKVYLEENLGVVFAMAAVAVHVVFGAVAGGSHFDFLTNAAVMTVLGSYVFAYALRIYIMNYYKNTRPSGARHDNKGFYAIEQIAATVTLAGVTILVLYGTSALGWNARQLVAVHDAIFDPPGTWGWATLSGTAFGIVSFFSVFIFMFKGRTATFAGLVNRLTSLIAGTTSTVLFALFFTGKMPHPKDWVALAFILTAVWFLTRAEKRRAAQLAAGA